MTEAVEIDNEKMLKEVDKIVDAASSDVVETKLTLDMVIMFDASGVVGPYVHKICNGIVEFVRTKPIDVRVGMIYHGFHNANNNTNIPQVISASMDFHFSLDAQNVKNYMMRINMLGYCDHDELKSVEEMLQLLRTLSWKAEKKILIIIDNDPLFDEEMFNKRSETHRLGILPFNMIGLPSKLSFKGITSEAEVVSQEIKDVISGLCDAIQMAKMR